VNEDTAGTVSLAATDANGDTLTWSVLTQGTKGTASASGTGSPKVVTYTPTANLNGSDSFVVQVSDGNGGTDTITVNVTITAVNDVPVATAQSVSVTEDTAKAITLAGSDVEGSALTYAIGTTPAKGVLSGTAPSLTYTPNLNATGADTFTFTVNDGTATSAAATVSITITAVNDVPVATAQSVTVTEDTAKAITLAGSDVEGSALTYAIGTAPTKGVLSGTAPNLTYTPNANTTGSDSFTFTVSDGTATSAAATVSITITAVNDTPVLASAIPDQTATVGVAFSYVVPEGTFTDVDNASLTWSSNEALDWLSFTAATRTFSGTPAAGDVAATTITVTASDGSLSASDSFVLTVGAAANTAPTITTTKPASLTVNEDTAGTVSLAATDANADTLTWSVLTQGTKGTASASGIGSPKVVTYTPTANLNGSDSFVVQVADGKGGTDTITVNMTITAVNDTPVLASAIPDQTATVGVAFSYVVPEGTFTDVDNASLTWSSNEALGWLSFTAATRTFAGTPAASDVAATTITVTASDGSLSASDSFVLTVSAVANTAPTITTTKPASLTVNEDTAGTVSLAATDANGDTLTWSVLTQGTKGTASASGTGSPKVVTYTPTANLNDSDSFVVQVADGKGGTDTITVNVTITAVNDAPVATAQSVSVTEDTAKAITLAGSDVEGSALTYAIGTAPTKGVLSGTVPNLTYTPNLNATGSDSFTFTVNDGTTTSAAATVSITITAVNDPPVNSVAPTTSGKSTVGRAQTATSGTWIDSDGSVTGYAYQWQRSIGGGAYADIIGATIATYTPLAGDAGFELRVQVTASDNGTPGIASAAAVSSATVVKAKSSSPTVTTSMTQATATPTVAGTGELSATIRVYDGTVLIGTVMVDGGGSWTWTPGTPLTPGTHLLTVTAELAPSGESSDVGPIVVNAPSDGTGTAVVVAGGNSGGGCGAGGLAGILAMGLSLGLMRRTTRRQK